VGTRNIFYIKLAPRGDVQFTKQELRNYEKIDDAELEAELRISRLHGLVRDDTGLVFGLLLTYIDCRAATLACAARANVPVSLRCKWATQVKSTVEHLHAAGIIWGDVKAENVLIDVNKEAWVIDFGGGYTEGCVDKESAGTVAGDLQGLAKIMSFLGV
jgi:serine/threonine protein kinase